MKPPPCVVDRWAGGSLTRRPKGPFAVSWPRQLGEQNVITLDYYLPQKRTPFFALFFEIRTNTQQVLPEQTDLYRYDE